MDYWNSLRLMNSIELYTRALSNIRIASPEAWVWDNFNLPFNKLYFIEEGSITVELLSPQGDVEKTWLLTPGNVYLIPSGNVYNLRTEHGFQKLYVHFQLIMDDGFDLFHGIRNILSLPWDCREFRNRQQSAENDPLMLAIYTKGLLYQLIIRFLEESTEEEMQNRLYAVSHYPAELLKVLRTIRTSANARLTIGEIARENGLSPSALTQMFKEYMGIPPKKYASNLLYVQACSLLLGTSFSVKKIAADLHFANPYAFSKFFKIHSNLSPQAFRKAHYISP